MARLLSLLNWKNLLRVARANHAPVVLGSRHIYILPTRYGWLFALMLLAMLTGSINYSLSLGFVLTFLLAGMGNMAMLHTWRNLAHLRVEYRRAEPVFAGEDALFEILVSDLSNRARYAVTAQFDAPKKPSKDRPFAPVYIDIAASSNCILQLALPATQRGWLTAGRITFYTEFPLSLFHVWSYAQLDCRCLVYPQPAATDISVASTADQGATGRLEARTGDDDFAGHRSYQYGDSPRRVDWKASSREQGLLTKQFQGEAQSSLWLDWALTPGIDAEQRIRQLTRWVVDAHQRRQSYGLRLPAQELLPDSSEAHYRQCLMALALLNVRA